MHGNLFYGCCTALVTPFRGNRVDFDVLEALIDWQLDSGIDAVLDLFGVFHHAQLALQLFLLTGLEPGGGDFLHLEAKHVHQALALSCILQQLFQ